MSSHPWTRYGTAAPVVAISYFVNCRSSAQSASVHSPNSCHCLAPTALAPAQDVRENAAAQLVAAMEDSQRGFAPAPKDKAASRPDASGMKRAEQALHKCSPLTVNTAGCPTPCLSQAARTLSPEVEWQ